MRYVGYRFISARWRDYIHHIVLLVVGFAAGILEWIAITAEGLKLSENTGSKVSAGPLKRLPRYELSYDISFRDITGWEA